MTVNAKPSLETDPELAEIVSDALDVVSNPTDLIVTVLVLLAALTIAVLVTRKIKLKLGHQRPVLLILVEYLCNRWRNGEREPL